MLICVTNAILLLAMGVGYIVCYLAKREEGVLKTAGYAIGITIVVLSAVILVNNMLLEASFCRMDKKMCAGMMMPHHGMMKGQVGGGGIMPMQKPGQESAK